MIWYVILGLMICVGALIGTMYVGKTVNQTIKSSDPSTQKETQVQSLSSTAYEKSSLKNVRLLTWIYVATFVISIILLAVFIINM
ncbi:hypothetical protein [Bacillus horti]|uniref:Anionic cell wall polymer biosynthesis LytR-Cps2A-Psr (LCP) family protein n=1 Tax=Caldalkalibacillus horti TaxID=77523 RepID=A0ABT9VXV1_9BACI|nr:hypothetical protein [Bacillus horti]MDQ0165807.1 anionic cell wall polymer biosynthesis LytR-Cps2A-Psr (LCP) family protein [Bacillus horti]